jgi:two-component system cell cycle sensor histidine kinase PleC
MSRTRDPSAFRVTEKVIPPEGGAALRRAVAQRQSAHHANAQEQRTSSGKTRLRQGMIPLSIAFAGIVAVTTALYASHTHTSVLNNASDRLAILADSTLLQISMAVTRADEGQEQAAAEPVLLNALAYRHVSNGIYAYVMSDNGDVLMSSATPNIDRLQIATPVNAQGSLAGRYHPLEQLQQPSGQTTTFDAQTIGGSQTITTTRQLSEPFGKLVVAMPQRRIHEVWVAEAGAVIGIVSLALLAFAGMMWLLRSTGRSFQDSQRDYNNRRLRYETALSRARCGLWDWDISRGRIIWSPTMSSLIGLPAEERVLSLGELESLTHPDDRHFRKIAEEIVAGNTSWIDHTFRLRHDNGSWIWIRARGGNPGLPGRIRLDRADRHRHGHHRTDAACRIVAHGGSAPARCHRMRLGSLCLVGSGRQSSAVQFQIF